MTTREVVLMLVTAASGAMLSGCLHASAKTLSDAPPLSAPPAPPRVIETVDAAPVAPLPLVEEPPRQPIRPATGTTPAPRTAAAPARAQDPPRSEPPASDSPTPVAEPAKPAPTLQTTPAGAEAEVERAIRSVIARTTSDLNRVDYRRLNQDGRTQYDTAKRFIQQAEEALRPPRKLEYARNLVDKAAALAAQLAR